ncbi:hypothetical protein DYB34_001356 [Aphanomyces astaci]|uniref:SEC63 domain-containing protein n=3 Tax=Aphanomyces astaci TaxID=112090 RepID=A0A3R7AAV6_APHAT|nr:hypothetical protein DYB34_001356 [Aphanomyces astaci]
MHFRHQNSSRECSGSRQSDVATSIATTTIHHLSDSALLRFTDDDRYCFHVTPSGRIMSQNCIKYDDMVAIRDLVQSKRHASMETLLDVMAGRICGHVPLRRNDKAALNALNQTKVQYRVKGAVAGKYLVQTDSMKANVLLQAALGRVQLNDDSLGFEMDTCVEMALRIVRALMEYCMESDAGALGLMAFRFGRSLALKAWESSPAPTKLQLLEGVDWDLAQKLDAHGVHSIRQLRDMDPTQLGRYLNAWDCEHLLAEAKTVLDFHLQVEPHVITNRIEIIVQNAQLRQVHRITERAAPNGYILLVFTKSRILLLRRDITTTPTTFMVPISGMSSISIHLLHTAQLGMDEELEVQATATDCTVQKVTKQSLHQCTIPEAFKHGRHGEVQRTKRSAKEEDTSKKAFHHHQTMLEPATVIPRDDPSTTSTTKRAKLSTPSLVEFKQFKWCGSPEVAAVGKSTKSRRHHVIPDFEELSEVLLSNGLTNHPPYQRREGSSSNINIQHVDTERQQGLSCASSSKNANDVKNDGADVDTIPMIDDYEELTLEQEFMKSFFGAKPAEKTSDAKVVDATEAPPSASTPAPHGESVAPSSPSDDSPNKSKTPQVAEIVVKKTPATASASKQPKKPHDDDHALLLYNPKEKNPMKRGGWTAGDPVPYAALSKVFAVIEDESSRLIIQDTLADFFRSVIELTPSDLVPCIYLCVCTELAPAYDNVQIGIGDAILIKSIGEATGTTPKFVKDLYQKQGDLGKVAQASRSKQSTLMTFQTKPKPLAVAHVYNDMVKIAKMSGNNSQASKCSIIKSLLVRCDKLSDEAKYVIRGLQGKLRIGLAGQSILVSLTQAFMHPKEQGDKALQAVRTLFVD